jgi:hypothetical protein
LFSDSEGKTMAGGKRIVLIMLSNILVAAITSGLTASWIAKKTLSKPQMSITAHEFILADESGRIGAKLAWDSNQPAMRLFDRAGHVRSALFLEPNGVPDLYLYDQNNVARAALNLFDSGVPNLAFLDAAQQYMVLTDYDEQHSYNTTFVRIGKDGNHTIASRRMTADHSGLHQADTGQVINTH